MAETVTSPLATIFTPPASCNSLWTYEAEYYNSVPGGILIQDALSEHPDTDCYPTGFEGFGRAPSVIQIFSPGACPVGYNTAGNTFNGATTTAVCCPSDFSYIATFSSINYFSTAAPFDGCISMYQSDAGLTTVVGRANDTDLNTTSVTGPLTMWAQPVSVAYRQVDLSLFTSITSSTPTSSSKSAAASPSSTPTKSLLPQTATPAAVVAQPPPNYTLSGGAIAGIAIAGAIVLGVVIGLFIFFRRRKTHLPATPLEQEKGYYGDTQRRWERGELDGTGKLSHAVDASPAYSKGQIRSQNTHLVELDS